MAKTNQAHKICRVQSHYLNYQVINKNFFVLPNGQNNFKALSSGLNESVAIDHIA